MSSPMKEDRFWWLAMALGLLRELEDREEREGRYITLEVTEADIDAAQKATDTGDIEL